MLSLNVRAVNARYGEGEAAEFRPLNFQYQPEPATPMSAFKALGCWQYQCSQGDVPDAKLYKLMQDVYNAMAVDMVTHSEAYEKATWG